MSALLSSLFGTVMLEGLAEVLCTRVRYSALAAGYNTVARVIGGAAPRIDTYVVAAMHDDLAPGWELIFAAIITLGVVSRFSADLPEATTLTALSSTPRA